MMEINNSILSSLVDEYGEAFYLLDSTQFRNNFIELKNTFSKIYRKFNIAYSYKTNYAPTFCKIVNELGGYAEVVSDMEMELAVRCGVPYHMIIWNGPIKNMEKVFLFLKNGGTVNVDTLSELESIAKFALDNKESNINVGIRCNFDVGDGVVSRFGFDSEGDDFAKALDIINSTPNITLINFQCHFAKRAIDFWPDRAKGMLAIIEKTGITPKRIDIGGGLYGKMDDFLANQFAGSIPDYAAYADATATLFANYFSKKEFMPELVIEPGSALVGDCMKFACMVKSIKDIRGKKFATLLGSQKNISMSGVNPPINVYSMGINANYYENVDLVGYTCIEGDVLFHDYSGRLSVGDMVVFSNCGSYSIVMKPPFILPNFPILDICGGGVCEVKCKESFEDIFHTFII